MLSFSNVFIIAKHEVLRFRSRFQGKTRFAIIVTVIAALAVFFFISIGGLVLSKEFYAIGIAPDGPHISDQRFHVLELDYNRGMELLQEGTIDAYVASNRAFYRKDSKSQYATGAIKQYLEGKELVRISNDYDIERSFPLRVEINYLKSSTDGTDATAGLSLAEIIDLSQNPSDTGPDSSSDVISTKPQNATDEVVKRQLEDVGTPNKLRQFKAEFASDKEVIIPSLMNPPIPLAQVLLAFFYVVPIFLVIIFFTSSFIEEKLNKRLSILLSTPTRASEIILGKMLPYFVYSLFIICAITLYLKGNVGLALAVFVPIVLFIFAVYLGVALLYRTFRDQTFFSMLAITIITGFLVFPAMFTGINNLSYISPLSLAVHMYRGEQFTGMEYLLSTGPMYFVFALAMIGGIRIFNEEYLTNYKPLHNKISDAIFLALNKKHLSLSIFIASLLLIPLVFMIQLGGIVLASNLPMPFALLALLTIGIVIEEIAKSCSIAVLIKHNLVASWKSALLLALISAAAFFLGEKLLLFFSMSIISESIFTMALFTTNLIWLPLLAHAISTLIIILITYRLGVKHYSTALIIGSAIHLFYNLLVMGIL
jgi:ABC-type Na+ efflux pump permease subunit